MSGKGTGGGAGRDQAKADRGRGGGDVVMDSLRFERAKNQVLLEEVVALEDEIVNRALADFESVVSDETREFWREQLLSNRAAATTALKELAEARAEGGNLKPEGQRTETRRPLHNRATARPQARKGFVGQGADAGGAGAGAGPGDDQAAKIRNRAHEISRAERVPFSAAFRRAEKELGGKG